MEAEVKQNPPVSINHSLRAFGGEFLCRASGPVNADRSEERSHEG